MSHIVLLDNLWFPLLRVKRNLRLAVAPANTLGMAFGIFMCAAPLMDWIDFASPTLGSCLCFAGICEYIIGILSWFEGRTLQSFIDFVFGFLHLVIFGTTELGKYSIYVNPNYHTYMQGTFYVFWLVMLLVVLIALKDRGFIYIIAFFFLALGCVFLIIWEFSGRTWTEKFAGYLFFFASLALWIGAFMQLLWRILGIDLTPIGLPRP